MVNLCELSARRSLRQAALLALPAAGDHVSCKRLDTVCNDKRSVDCAWSLGTRRLDQPQLRRPDNQSHLDGNAQWSTVYIFLFE